MRAHVLVTTLFLSVYLMVAFFDPGFLSYDLRQKFNVFASSTLVVTARVLDVPQKPVVTGSSLCDHNTGVLSVVLDWADDPNTYTFDITRDSLPLVSGLTPSGYTDNNVVVNTTYQYVVTAHGPMGPGFATADPITVTTLAECEIVVPAPTVTLMSFAGRGVDTYIGLPSVTDRRPIFTGTTNIPNATIQVVVGPPSSFLAEVHANINGYFAWQPPLDLAYGIQTFTVTAIDPNDVSRHASTSLQFEIQRSEGGGGGGGSKKSSHPTSNPVVTPPVLMEVPIDFSLTVENKDQKIFQGEKLDTLLFIKSLAQQYQNKNVPVRFSIVDAQGNTIISNTFGEWLKNGAVLKEGLDIPLYVTPGKYSVRVEMVFDGTNVSRSAEFTLMALPLISLGGGAFITYAEIMRNLGWITLTLLVLFLVWLYMFLREYGLYLHAIRHITEWSLGKAGFMTKRKEGIE